MPKRIPVQTLIADLTRIEALAAAWRRELSRAARSELRGRMGAQAAVISGGGGDIRPVPVGGDCPPPPKGKKKSKSTKSTKPKKRPAKK